jgi:hypothetical protein
MICHYCCRGYIADGFDVGHAPNAAAQASSIAAKASGQMNARSIRGKPRLSLHLRSMQSIRWTVEPRREARAANCR